MTNKKTIMTIAICAAMAAGIGGIAYYAGTRNSTGGSGSVSGSSQSASGASAAEKNNNPSNAGQDSNATASGATVTDMALKITDKDNETTYDAEKSNLIDLSSTSGAVKISDEGTYIVTGSTDEGMLVIDAGEEGDVHLVLRDASILSPSSAAIYVVSADEVYITLEGSNTLANGGTYKAIDENDIDAVIFSKDDLTINGSGSLKIDTDAEHAIVCKDDMVITGGTYDLTAKTDAINTNDSLAITSGNFTINCGDDAIHTDGILQIDGGSFEINAAEGLEGTYITINDGTFSIKASDDGINAAQKVSDYRATLVVNGGDIKITMGSGDTDGIDSNGDIYINGGTIDVSGQSTIDYDGTAVKNGGTLILNGMESDTIPNQLMGGGRGGRGGMAGNPGEGGFPADGGAPADGGFPGNGGFPGENAQDANGQGGKGNGRRQGTFSADNAQQNTL